MSCVIRSRLWFGSHISIHEVISLCPPSMKFLDFFPSCYISSFTLWEALSIPGLNDRLCALNLLAPSLVAHQFKGLLGVTSAAA